MLFSFTSLQIRIRNSEGNRKIKPLLLHDSFPIPMVLFVFKNIKIYFFKKKNVFQMAFRIYPFLRNQRKIVCFYEWLTKCIQVLKSVCLILKVKEAWQGAVREEYLHLKVNSFMKTFRKVCFEFNVVYFFFLNKTL